MKLSAPVHVLKRKARRLCRTEGIRLHEALDRIARDEGFRRWSHLSDTLRQQRPARGLELFSRCQPGELLLLGGRPGQGKTLVSLEMAVAALRAGHRAVFCTLEYTERDVHRRLRQLRVPPSLQPRLEVVTDDAISAGHIAELLDGAPPGTLVVVDYLQLLDQQRTKPPLAEQLTSLKTMVEQRGWVIVCLSQIDRRFEASARSTPEAADVRLPNPVDLGQFTRMAFVHDGVVATRAVSVL